MTTEAIDNQDLGTLTAPDTLSIRRHLPGPIERVWASIVKAEQRRLWVAGGDDVPDAPGQQFEMVWRNDELSASPAERPDGFPEESRSMCTLLEIDAPRFLRYDWPGVGEVSMSLKAAGDGVVLHLVHRRLSGENLMLNVRAGWPAHLALLVARLEGQPVPSLWATWKRLRQQVERL